MPLSKIQESDHPPLPVLFLIQHLHIGGTEDHLHDLIIGLDRTRFEPHLIHFNDEEGIVAQRIAAKPWIRKSFMRVTRAYDLSGWRAVAFVRRYLRTHRIRVVMTFHFVSDFIGTLGAAGTGIPVISSRRDMGFSRTKRMKTMGRWLDRGVTRYIAVSDAVRRAIAADEGIALEKIEVIYNGIEPEALERNRIDVAAERRRDGYGPDEILIACIANFNKVKGHLTLVEAFARLLGEHPGAPLCLLLAGGGPLEAEIRARVAELGLENKVAMPGFSKNAAREFQMADIFVLPSETEGFSNSIVQAMAYGKPVVACAVGGNPEAVVEGETGLLVPPKDPSALAAALGRVALDPGIRTAMGAKGVERARGTFTVERMMQAQQALLERVAAGRGKGRGSND